MLDAFAIQNYASMIAWLSPSCHYSHAIASYILFKQDKMDDLASTVCGEILKALNIRKFGEWYVVHQNLTSTKICL